MHTHHFLVHMLVEVSGCKHLSFFYWDMNRVHWINLTPWFSFQSSHQDRKVKRPAETGPQVA